MQAEETMELRPASTTTATDEEEAMMVAEDIESGCGGEEEKKDDVGVIESNSSADFTTAATSKDMTLKFVRSLSPTITAEETMDTADGELGDDEVDDDDHIRDAISGDTESSD